MMVWALDMATHTGECWGAADGGLPTLGSNVLPSTGRDVGTFLAAHRAWFLRRIDLIKPDFIVFEAPFASNDGAARKLMGLANVVELCCYDLQIPCGEVPPISVKKSLAGSGRAKKPQMIAAARAYGVEPADDNEADAFGTWLHAVRELCPEHRSLWPPLTELFAQRAAA
jgi:crossover junction endodeoxyribonuclease RuvC